MSIKRYGADDESTTNLPFSRAVQADGWLYVSGQVPMRDGVLVTGDITEQAHQTLRNIMAILAEAGYSAHDVVRCGVWLENANNFPAFNHVFREYFRPHLPARACIISRMVVDCKVEVDCVAYKKEKAET